ERHQMLWLFGVKMAFLSLRRSHHETPWRHHEHLGASVALLEHVFRLERALLVRRQRIEAKSFGTTSLGLAKLKPKRQRRPYPYQDCNEPHWPKSPGGSGPELQLTQAYQAGKSKQEAARLRIGIV